MALQPRSPLNLESMRLAKRRPRHQAPRGLYVGKNVREANTTDGMVEWDTCYFNDANGQSRIAYQNQVSGGWWPVQTASTGAQGTWQYDSVGWSEDSIKYYRGQLSGGWRTYR